MPNPEIRSLSDSVKRVVSHYVQPGAQKAYDVSSEGAHLDLLSVGGTKSL